MAPSELSELEKNQSNLSEQADYEEFEIGHHKVPWFLWLFFSFIIMWASVSWIKFFGY